MRKSTFVKILYAIRTSTDMAGLTVTVFVANRLNGESSIVPVKVTVPVLLPAALAKAGNTHNQCGSNTQLLLYSFNAY